MELVTKNFLNPETLSPPKYFSQVVEVQEAKRLIYVSGQVSVDKEGNVVGVGDIKKQAEQAFSNLREALRSVNAELSDLVRLTVYLTNMEDLPQVREVRRRYTDEKRPPASTVVEIKRLGRIECMIEVEATAAV